ncbi:MBL fold metallo-hydrolase [Rhodococcus erythropolis]|uniref:MBL fold metallo-hydrolase n=1 Tax=Rhodococcus erythropolis TaxID=1833 RepID=UPI00210C2A3E|nr:MBL fold metallo-hydrolase [Rhodococcus erythropolis]
MRNATMTLEYGGMTVLVDPMLGARGSIESFPNPTGNPARNPLVDLPMPINVLLSPDVVVVTHTHADHWDDAARALLPREVPILAQHAKDAATISQHGFTDVQVLNVPMTVGGVEFTRTSGQHGSDAVFAEFPGLGDVMGVVLRHPDEPSVYVAGDTVLNDHVRQALATYGPDVVVLNTGEAALTEAGPIIMGPRDAVEIVRLVPEARVIAVHLEALNHCPATREDVRSRARADGVADRVLVPADGETLAL